LGGPVRRSRLVELVAADFERIQGAEHPVMVAVVEALEAAGRRRSGKARTEPWRAMPISSAPVGSTNREIAACKPLVCIRRLSYGHGRAIALCPAAAQAPLATSPGWRGVREALQTPVTVTAISHADGR
jgi:hypothetical protein